MEFKKPKTWVKSCDYGPRIGRRIEIEASKQQKTESYILRLLARKALGMKVTGEK